MAKKGVVNGKRENVTLINKKNYYPEEVPSPLSSLIESAPGKAQSGKRDKKSEDSSDSYGGRTYIKCFAHRSRQTMNGKYNIHYFKKY